jgi:class 3 adenylate cyclase/predicted ATPase
MAHPRCSANNLSLHGESPMTFEEVVDQASAMLQRRGRVTYRLLKRQFNLDDEALEDLKEELIYGQKLAVDEDDGRVLIWTGAGGQRAAPPSSTPPSAPAPDTQEDAPSQRLPSPVAPHPLDAERRQLTVMFCDLVDSTALSSQLDPEDLREVVRAYQEVCAKVIARFEGHIAQYLGDGLLVYFGYPGAHEDDAQRAVRTGLGIVEALGQLNTHLAQEWGVRLAVRLGIHTGLVVVGSMGGGGRQEQLALGETPNIAARLQGLAAPDTLVISAVTARLVEGYFILHSLGMQDLKGLASRLQVYQVLYASETQTRLDVAAARGLTPLVGRDAEVTFLQERWTQAQDGWSQVVLINGEPGIGKSRLVQVLKEQVAGERYTRIEYRCASHTQHSAFYPVIAHLERALAFRRDDTSDDKHRKLEAALAPYAWPLPDTVPLLAALLSLPLPAHAPPLTLTPQRQRQKTLEALLAWLCAEATRHPVLFIVEDLHWIDPSTLEFLTLLLAQEPTARILTVLTCRPEFHPPWPLRAHVTLLTLSRLAHPQAAQMMRRMTGDRTLPLEIVQQVVAKTDGVPLFVEELTKTVLESGFLREANGAYELTEPLPSLAIPATLHDSLMARLDRLSMVKTVAQLGAIIGRTFAFELLQAVAPLDDATLQHALAQLVDAELLYQRGVPPQATYTFKHALIQDAAYQSLLRSTRQQYHQQIAQVLEAQFPASVETQPELIAQHYTAAGCAEQAVPYWHRAGQHASDCSANLEAISHFTTGIELLKTLPETPEHTRQALALYIGLGAALQVTKGQAAPEVEHAYIQARALCQQVGETPQLVPVLLGLYRFYLVQSQYRTARELGETLLRLAQHADDPALTVLAHYVLGALWFWLGVLPAARQHLEEGIARYTPDQSRALVFRMGLDPGVGCRAYAASTLWLLGYPEQALACLHEALALARELSHSYTLAWMRSWAAHVYQLRRDVPAVYEHAEAAVALSTEQGFPLWAALGTSMRGWGLALQDQGETGLAYGRQGVAAWRATNATMLAPYLCTVLVDVCDHLGYLEEGLQVLAEAQTLVERHEERWWEAEICRLQGVLLLRQPGTSQDEAEACFRQALDVARRQEAKSLELRAAMSLSRLWQQQGKRTEARELLAPVYGWFTEGFDTSDLVEAKALLEELS